MKPLAALALALLPLGLQAQPVPLPADPAADWSIATSERRIAVEGGEVWVRVNGVIGPKTDNAATPVIFIHGGPGGMHVNFGHLLSLADQRPVILYDQLDSGMSDHPEDPVSWNPVRFVAELEAIRRELGVERRHGIGQHDEARLDTVQDFVALTPGCELAVVPGGSHAFIGERPEVAEALFGDRMKRVDARAGAGQ
ncbi:MAG: alpha/beta fold hydrolase [Erythrobacter sp.]